MSPTCPVDRALLAGLGCCRQHCDDGPEARVAYLAAKRPIDAAAYNRDVISALEAELWKAAQPAPHTPETTLRVFDLGCGTLSMLGVVEAAAARAGYRQLEYLAFDSDAALLDAAAAAQVHEHGYCSGGEDGEAAAGTSLATAGIAGERPTLLHTLTSPPSSRGLSVRLTLHLANVLDLDQHVTYRPRRDGQAAPATAAHTRPGANDTLLATPDLLVASGFADLLPAVQLAALLARLAPNALAYLPITFAGVTRAEPAFGARSPPLSEPPVL